MGQNPLSYTILYNESKHNVLKGLGRQGQQNPLPRTLNPLQVKGGKVEGARKKNKAGQQLWWACLPLSLACLVPGSANPYRDHQEA
jgi:hypothetical protein